MKPAHVVRLRLAAAMLILIVATIAILSGTSLADGGGPAPTSTPSGTRPDPIIYRPAGLSTAQRVPLLVALYGAAGCPQCMEGLTHFEAVASQHGFVVAYPGSVMVNGAPWQSSDDIPYISSLISQIEASQNIDPTRVYVAGFSAGGRFAYQLGCALSKQITAVAVVSSVQRPYACPLSHPVSELTIMGSLGALNGIPARGVPSSYTVESWWRQRDGCAQPIRRASVAPLSEETSGPCVDGSTVGLYIVQGGHHTWPGCSCKLPPSDPDSQWNASQGIWSFFSNLQTGSLTTPGAQIVALRSAGAAKTRRVTATFALGEQVTVRQTLLSARGRRLASKTSTLARGGRVSLLLPVPRKTKPGSYSVTVRVTDAYGRTLTAARKIRVST